MILNRQKKVRLAARPLAVFLARIQRELRLENWEVSIAFVSDAEIARWNERYRSKKGPTDVLSFPVEVASNGSRRKHKTRGRGKSAGITTEFLGDVAIAPETARRYARKNGRTLNHELRVLMLHGVLHLLGYDHESDNGQMNRIEQRLRRRLGIA
jgi:probable rRNA maturation factor